ncbi:3-hydroxyacyl-ACP dehydratase FabZ family protein [Brevundimonas sp. FT23042]|uniref:3-hydroxyacyl-ACP dehydratase FabZ family protein n=1 Tax=Brevundimonas sp. FT23042 TaxID=3393749 RepID=UPI003B58B1D1
MKPALFVPADHPALPGHFPGNPLVPGVMILDLLADDWRATNPETPLRGIHKAKFQRMLKSGETVRVAWTEVRDDKVSFRAFVGDEILATGQFALA